MPPEQLQTVAPNWVDGYQELFPLTADQVFSLRAEAAERYAQTELDQDDSVRGALPDGSFASTCRLRSAPSGPVLAGLHEDPQLKKLVQDLTGRENLQLTRRGFTYYGRGDFLGIHRDVQACVVTLLIGVTSNLSPLGFAPSLRGKPNHDLQQYVDENGPFPDPEFEHSLPRDRFLAIDGRRIPHWRTPHLDSKPGIIATLCYFEEGFSVEH